LFIADDLAHSERRLPAAQLGGDVAALDRLLDDRLVAIGPDGARFTKDDDLLHAHLGARRPRGVADPGGAHRRAAGPRVTHTPNPVGGDHA